MTKKIDLPKHSVLYYVLAPIWVAALVLLDQKIKQYAVQQLKGTAGSSLIPGVLGLEYVENHGMAFGMLQNAGLFFIIVTVLVLIVFCLLYLAVPEKKRLFPISAGLVFLTLEFISFPVFNLADCFLTWTAVLLAVLFLVYYKNEDLEQIRLWKKSA